LSDSDIVSRSSVARPQPAHGNDADSGTGKAAKPSDADAVSDGDKRASPAPAKRRASNDAPKDRD
jgi:hypothetical protein